MFRNQRTKTFSEFPRSYRPGSTTTRCVHWITGPARVPGRGLGWAPTSGQIAADER